MSDRGEEMKNREEDQPAPTRRFGVDPDEATRRRDPNQSHADDEPGEEGAGFEDSAGIEATSHFDATQRDGVGREATARWSGTDDGEDEPPAEKLSAESTARFDPQTARETNSPVHQPSLRLDLLTTGDTNVGATRRFDIEPAQPAAAPEEKKSTPAADESAVFSEPDLADAAEATRRYEREESSAPESAASISPLPSDATSPAVSLEDTSPERLAPTRSDLPQLHKTVATPLPRSSDDFDLHETNLERQVEADPESTAAPATGLGGRTGVADRDESSRPAMPSGARPSDPRPSSTRPPGQGPAGTLTAGSPFHTRPPTPAPLAGEAPAELLEKPFSLAPDEPVPSETTPTAPRHAVPWTWRRRSVWLGAGAALGLAVFTWLYLRPWPAAEFRMDPPQWTQGKPLASIDQTAPPAKWILKSGLFFGRDAANRPWIYDPVTGRAERGSLSAPSTLEAGAFTLVARPPLESWTRLAWIEGGRLICRDYEFATADTPSAVSPPGPGAPLNLVLALGADKVPFPPTALDDPRTSVGSLLVVVEEAGTIMAWRTATFDAPSTAPLWRQSLAGRPVHAPLAWLDTRGKAPMMRIITLTELGIEVFDPADGRPLGRATWPERLGSSPARLTRLRLKGRGQGSEWGWCILGSELQSSGGLAWSKFAVDGSGKPLLAESGKIKTHTQNLMSLPDGAAPEGDLVVAISISKAAISPGITLERGNGTSNGPMDWADGIGGGGTAALDLNADGWPDQIGISRLADDKAFLAVVNGRTRRRVDQSSLNATGPVMQSGIVWRIDKGTLRADFMGSNATPSQLVLPLSKMADDEQKKVEHDLEMRQRRD